MPPIKSFVEQVVGRVEPIEDRFYGRRYRCSLTLKDGTFIPCAVIQSKSRLIDLAKRRITEEMGGAGILRGEDPYGQIVASFVTNSNRIADYHVQSASESKFAIPLPLLREIHGETTMGWTGWVFRMTDGGVFSYGSTFSMEFFQLPEGYEFSDVEEVINHAFVDSSGAVSPLRQGAGLPPDYPLNSVLRERAFFICAVDGI